MKMDSAFIPQIKHGIMDEDDESLGSFSSSNNSPSSSSSSELTEDTASSGSSSPTNSYKGPLFELSSLKQQLPFKRGVSKFYEGRSQSYTSLSDVRSLEDLVKPERPLKRLKLSRSCGALRFCSKRTITKKATSSSNSTVSGRIRNYLLGSKTSLYPQRPSNLSDQAL